MALIGIAIALALIFISMELSSIGDAYRLRQRWEITYRQQQSIGLSDSQASETATNKHYKY